MRLSRLLFCVAIMALMLGQPILNNAQTKKPGKAVVVSDADLVAWVDARIKERMPAPEERTLDQIGWAKDVREALALAKKHNRPVFLFTHDGRINLGRC